MKIKSFLSWSAASMGSMGAAVLSGFNLNRTYPKAISALFGIDTKCSSDTFKTGLIERVKLLTISSDTPLVENKCAINRALFNGLAWKMFTLSAIGISAVALSIFSFKKAYNAFVHRNPPRSSNIWEQAKKDLQWLFTSK